MRKRYKIGLIVIIILIVIVSAIGILKIFQKDKPNEPKNVTNIISNINDYGYTLDDRDTKYMSEVFAELESVLNESEIDYDAYAECLAKLFVIDFYTLDNKTNKYDVGSLEYILSDKVDLFQTKAIDTIYKDIQDNTYKDRVQELPEITNVEIINNETEEITLGEEKVEATKISMKYEYKKDLGYDKEGTIYLVKNKNKLEVAIYNPTIEK